MLEFAPRAAAKAARLGAHREAAEGYRLALRCADGVLDENDSQCGDLLEALAYECYLTDQLDEALAARRRALEVAEWTGNARASGRNECWISRLCWPLGRPGESEAFAVRAVATLQGAGYDGPELAMALSNLAQRRMLAGDTAAAVAAGNRAIDIARRVGDRDVEIDALTNVGTALSSVDDDAEGTRLLQRSLDLALLGDVHELAARAWTNLGSIAVRNRRLPDADRLLRAGIDVVHRPRPGLLGSAHAGVAGPVAGRAGSPRRRRRPGRASTRAPAPVGRSPGWSPPTSPASSPAVAAARRRAGWPKPSRWPQEPRTSTVPVSAARVEAAWLAARAEAAWLAGRLPDIVEEVDRAWPAAVALRNPWTLGELSWWLAVTGLRRTTSAPVAPPFALMLEGSWRAAARAWNAIGCPLWEALALGASPSWPTAGGRPRSPRAWVRPRSAPPCCAPGRQRASRFRAARAVPPPAIPPG